MTSREELLEKVEKIEHLLGRDEHDAGYEAFVWMRKVWPDIKAALVTPAQAARDALIEQCAQIAMKHGDRLEIHSQRIADAIRSLNGTAVSSTTRATPIMRAAENAAKVVDGWSDAKKDYAERVTASSVSSTKCRYPNCDLINCDCASHERR